MEREKRKKKKSQTSVTTIENNLKPQILPCCTWKIQQLRFATKIAAISNLWSNNVKIKKRKKDEKKKFIYKVSNIMWYERIFRGNIYLTNHNKCLIFPSGSFFFFLLSCRCVLGLHHISICCCCCCFVFLLLLFSLYFKFHSFYLKYIAQSTRTST